jgi:hypothetical protein
VVDYRGGYLFCLAVALVFIIRPAERLSGKTILSKFQLLLFFNA